MPNRRITDAEVPWDERHALGPDGGTVVAESGAHNFWVGVFDGDRRVALWRHIGSSEVTIKALGYSTEVRLWQET